MFEAPFAPDAELPEEQPQPPREGGLHPEARRRIERRRELLELRKNLEDPYLEDLDWESLSNG